MVRVLLVGESEILNETRHKGFDVFQAATRMSDAQPFIDAIEAAGHDVVWLDSESAAEGFPNTAEELDRFDVVVLSDIGSNTLLIPRKVHEGYVTPNRLAVLRDWVAEGGAFLMCGGWTSFAGMHGVAHYHRTPVEEMLPVSIHPFDDRMESPQGVIGQVLSPDHPIVSGVPAHWPPLLGYNWVVPSEGAQVVVAAENGDPLLAVGEYGGGRAAAWTSDVAPHWVSREFAAWEGYNTLFGNMVSWLAKEETA